MTLASSDISPIQVDGSMMTTWYHFLGDHFPLCSCVEISTLWAVYDHFDPCAPGGCGQGDPLWYLVVLLRSSLELWGARLQTPICFFGPRRKKSAGMIIVQVACLPDRVAQC